MSDFINVNSDKLNTQAGLLFFDFRIHSEALEQNHQTAFAFKCIYPSVETPANSFPPFTTDIPERYGNPAATDPLPIATGWYPEPPLPESLLKTLRYSHYFTALRTTIHLKKNKLVFLFYTFASH